MQNLIFTFLIILGFSCSNKESSVLGAWRSHGSGWILNIQDSSAYELFDINSLSCLPKKSGSFLELSKNLSMHRDTLHLKKGLNSYKFYRISKLPDLCAETIPKGNAIDVLFNFDVFAQTVEEHYAFMELNEIDWPMLKSIQRRKLENDPTDLTLYRVLEETLELLNDNHAYLEATTEFYNQYKSDLYDTGVEDSLPEIGDFQVANMVAKHNLKEDMTRDSWLMNWGKMTDHIGFIQIKAMWLYANLEMPDSLKEEMGFVDAYVHTFHQMDESTYIQMERLAVSKTMKAILSDFKELDTVILDVRFNGGGQDAVSQEIIRHFNPSTEIKIKRQLKAKEGLLNIETLSIKPYEEALDVIVYVLVSPQTGSAAESFSMSARQMENATLIGSATMGALSTSLEKVLPNGWSFAISDELNLDYEGRSFENIGVPVDYKLNYSRDRQTFFRYVTNNLEEDKLNILQAMRSNGH